MKLVLFLAALCVIASANTIEPSFDAYRDVVMWLTTRSNRHTPYQLLFRNQANLNASPFNSQRQTRILIHGWWQDDTTDINAETVQQLLDVGDFNVIFIDWSAGSQTINYAAAVARTQSIGHFLASHLNWMNEIGRLNFDLVSIIGFSLGGHIGGFTGKNTRSLMHTIIALDPAGLLFDVNDPTTRVDAGDAQYVECIHTNGGLTGAGIGAHICQADFFPNGGQNQPGCLTNACSHLRSIPFYIESIQRNGFHSTRCDSEFQANRENCNSGSGFWFGGEPSNHNLNLRGIFHFRTNRNPPFSQGPFRPW